MKKVMTIIAASIIFTFLAFTKPAHAQLNVNVGGWNPNEGYGGQIGFSTAPQQQINPFVGAGFNPYNPYPTFGYGDYARYNNNPLGFNNFNSFNTVNSFGSPWGFNPYSQQFGGSIFLSF